MGGEDLGDEGLQGHSRAEATMLRGLGRAVLLTAVVAAVPVVASGQGGSDSSPATGGSLDPLLSWAAGHLGALPQGVGGRIGREVPAALLEPGRHVAWVALREGGIWGGIGLVAGLVLTFLTAWWMRARAVLGCLWALIALPCMTLGAFYCGLWVGGARALSEALDPGLLLERVAVTGALAANTEEGEELSSGAGRLSLTLADAGSGAEALLKEGGAGLGQLGGSQGELGQAMLSPELLNGVVEAIGKGKTPSPGVLMALASGPEAIDRLPERERGRARSLVDQTATLRLQAIAAVGATAWGNVVVGGLAVLLPLVFALPVGLLVRLLGRQRTAPAGTGGAPSP
jgi:hypothetical protein